MHQRYLKNLKYITNIQSFTSNKKEVNKVNHFFIDQFTGLGLKVKRFSSPKTGDLIIARAGANSRQGNILLSGHTDIVPLTDFNKFSIKGNKCFGNGVADMKSGLVVMLGVLEELNKQNLLNNVICVLVPDEETGSQTYKDYLVKIYQKQDYAFVFEPALEKRKNYWQKERWLVTTRKGVSQFKIDLKGDGGHSGNKLTNRNNVIEEMARKILRLHLVTNIKKGTTVNVGTILGGEAPNIIARNCEAMFDLRATNNKEYAKILNKIKNIVDVNKLPVKSTYQKLIDIPPLETNFKTKIMFESAKQIFKEMKLKLINDLRGGGSDGNQIGQYGVGVLDALGPVGENLHTPNEWIYKDSIVQSISIVIKIIQKLHKYQ